MLKLTVLASSLRFRSLSIVFAGLATLAILFTNCQQAPQPQNNPSNGSSGAAPTPTPTPTPVPCPSPSSVGFRILEYSPGLKAAIWYPSGAPSAAGATYNSSMSGDAILNAAPMNCGNYPTIVFSHGVGACGTQAAFLMEGLARRGYIIVAPDHLDALCSVDGGTARGPYPANPNPANTSYDPSFTDSHLWNDSTHADRRNDIQTLMSYLGTSLFNPIMDQNRLGLAGHSLGGYTTLGLAGGWNSWRDSRFKAALLLSPYLLPYLLPYPTTNVFAGIQIPVMYQGGTLDTGITPYVAGPRAPYTVGAYDASNATKYFLEITGAGHLAWSNQLCTGAGANTVAQCMSVSAEARLIVDYSVAFFEKTLRSIAQPLLQTRSPGLRTYRFDEAP